VNQLIVEGRRHKLHGDTTYTVEELSQLIVKFYWLNENVAEALCFAMSRSRAEP
jgi:hypothetical protein